MISCILRADKFELQRVDRLMGVNNILQCGSVFREFQYECRGSEMPQERESRRLTSCGGLFNPGFHSSG